MVGRLGGESDEYNDHVFPDDDGLGWTNVAKASGARWPLYNSRSQSKSALRSNGVKVNLMLQVQVSDV